MLSDVFYQAFKSIAFQCDPEWIHDQCFHYFENHPQIASLFKLKNEKKFETRSHHLEWQNPFSIASGFDKNARAIPFFNTFGLGALEIGTVTPRAQTGNSRPRIKRLVNQQSLINSMGFPNDGADSIFNRLKSYKGEMSLGINIGKNKLTPNDKAIEDYSELFKRFHHHGNYLVVNISSPNTPGLRSLQNKLFLTELFQELNSLRDEKSAPLYLKLSPDLEFSALDDIIQLSIEQNLAGLIATNTTSDHPLDKGGLSGELLKVKSHHFREQILKEIQSIDSFDLIGAGGFSSFEGIKSFWKSGGCFVQIYTAFIYQGPALFGNLLNQLDLDMKKYNCSDFDQYLKAIRH